MGEAQGELDNPPTNVYMNPFMRENRVQLFQKTIVMTDMMIASTMHGGTYGGDFWKQGMHDRLIEQRRDIDSALWFNENHWARNSGGNIVMKTEGVIHQIRNNGGFRHTYGANCDKSELYGFLSLAKRGSKKKTMFIGDELGGMLEEILDTKYGNQAPMRRYGAIKGDNVIEVFQIRVLNVIVDVIRCPSWEGKYKKSGIILDDSYVYPLHFAPDKKGSRKARVEFWVGADGKPTENAQLLSQLGVGIGAGAVHGILEP